VARLLEDLAHSLPDWLLHIPGGPIYTASRDRADSERERLPAFLEQALGLMHRDRAEALGLLGGWWGCRRIHDMAANICRAEANPSRGFPISAGERGLAG
jgi:hypothetical protein